jgi:hypothetical protein
VLTYQPHAWRDGVTTTTDKTTEYIQTEEVCKSESGLLGRGECIVRLFPLLLTLSCVHVARGTNWTDVTCSAIKASLDDDTDMCNSDRGKYASACCSGYVHPCGLEEERGFCKGITGCFGADGRRIVLSRKENSGDCASTYNGTWRSVQPVYRGLNTFSDVGYGVLPNGVSNCAAIDGQGPCSLKMGQSNAEMCVAIGCRWLPLTCDYGRSIYDRVSVI